MAKRERAYLRPMQTAAIAHPQDASEDDGDTGEKPTRPQNQGLEGDHRDRRHTLLEFELQCAAAAIAGNRPNGNEGQKERCGNLIGTKGWRDDAIEREQRISKSCRGPTLSTRFRVRPDGLDEGHPDER